MQNARSVVDVALDLAQPPTGIDLSLAAALCLFVSFLGTWKGCNKRRVPQARRVVPIYSQPIQVRKRYSIILTI